MEERKQHEAGPATPLAPTPGPWVYDPEFGEVTAAHREVPIPPTTMTVVAENIVAESVLRNNGPLIAAAPETLQTLDEVVHALETAVELIRDVDSEAAEELDAIVGRGMDQIARAEGREQ